MPISLFDINNISNILSGEGDWFTAKLLRLMADADESNLRRLAQAFPREFIEFILYKYAAVPTRYADIDVVLDLMHKLQMTDENLRYLWVDSRGVAGRNIFLLGE